MNWLKTAAKRESLRNYYSRSEVEFSCILTLVKYGQTYDRARGIFEGMQPGHYRELGNNRHTYLKSSWDKAVKEFTSNPTRIELANQFNSIPTLRLATDMNVLRSLYISAYIAGSFTCNVDQLTLSLYSGVNSKQTVRRSISRLVEAGFVNKLPNNKFRSNCYEMGNFHPRKTTPDIYLTGVNISVFARVLKSISGSAQQVYLVLSEEPQTVKEIVAKTGKCSKTVRDTLGKLEYYSMAFGVKRVWVVGDANINNVANMLGIYEEVANHKDKIKQERFVEKEKRRIYNEYMAQKALPNECKNSIMEEKD